MPFGDEVLYQAIVEAIGGEFDMLLGRRTYEIFAGYWPNKNNAIAKAFNKATKYVVTRSLKQLDWKHSLQLGGDVVGEVRRLKASDGPALHIWGSSELLQTLIAAELVDEYRMWVAPVVLGEGRRLFQNGVPPRALTLVETRSTPKGVLINTYHPAGPLPRGSAQPESPSEAELVRRRKLAAEGSGNLTSKEIFVSRQPGDHETAVCRTVAPRRARDPTAHHLERTVSRCR